MKKQSPSLKIKIMSLAAEAHILRAQEKRAARQIKKLPEKYYHAAIALRLRARNWRAHRVGALRQEARCALLAQAYIGGIPYRTIEVRVRPGNEPDWKRIEEMARRFSGWVGDVGFEPWRTAGLAVPGLRGGILGRIFHLRP